MNILGSLELLTAGYGAAIGAFLTAFVSNAIPYMTVPYLVVIAGYGAALNSVYEKILVALAGGLGAGLGKVVVYMLGRGVHQVLPERARENVELFAHVFSKGMFIAIFLFAALPLPDDVLYIPVGVAGYNPLLFFIAVTLGKIIITSLAVLLGNVVASLTGSEGGFNPETIAGLIVASIIVSIVIVRMNWNKIIEVYDEKGVIPAFIEMIKQAFLALLPVRSPAWGGRPPRRSTR
ncbi:hypothetical protein CF15_05125 [Pyrodictium occultum]|uniref:VTT domain-containing protein n=1 Tax=Pyrodictium occultum TaxID=2309 RepID=A0A0V8RVT5_PYROC|nr:hypothetical protein CF15_05125 [Pyrodictium occultum]